MSDIYSHILFAIYSDSPIDMYYGLLSGNLSDISSDILPGICFDLIFGTLSGILSDIYF